MALSDLYSGVGINMGISTSSLYWIAYALVIIIITAIVCLLFFHFIVRKFQFNILVERKRIIQQDGKKYLIDDTNEWGKLSKDKTRMILKNQGKFLGYFNKIKFSAPPEDYIRPTLFNQRKVTMIFNGYNDLEYTYSKNAVDTEKNINIQPVEIDTLGVIISDWEHEAQKRRLSAPIEKVAMIGAFATIVTVMMIAAVFIVIQNREIAQAQTSMASSCGNLEQTCIKYMQQSQEICDKKYESIINNNRGNG